jgi:hypothetical protein
MGLFDLLKKSPNQESTSDLIKKLEDKIPKYVKENHDLVSLCNVWVHFKPDSVGDEEIKFRFPEHNFTAIIWADVSTEFNSAINNLEAKGKLFVIPISIDIYVLDCTVGMHLPILPHAWEEIDPNKQYFFPHALTTNASIAENILKQPRQTTFTRVFPGGKIQNNYNIW